MPGQNLTRDEAQGRAARITVRHYDVDLDLNRGEETFGSTTTIHFDAEAGASTFVDLIASSVHAITLNGQPVDVDAYRDSRIELQGLAEHNELRVEAECAFMHTGEGLHRFVDPADGQAYCYSQFEVPDARRVFATFEQPDMKATFAFTVTTPPGWTVLSNSPTPDPVEGEGGRRFAFTPTEQISTYITAIVAGPYVGRHSSLTSSDGRKIPLGVYARASLERHLDADAIFDLTKRGFAFYEKQYGRPFPFRKYDQVFVPEYNAGAMENAGCVTFRDEYVFRSAPTEAQRANLANTVLHELAHMWFGDLVTMRWWDDIWLNESFAEFMSHLAMAEATEFTDAWTDFLVRKEWGLKQDQLPSTHPITAELPDLDAVEGNFDGITYAKGAAVLRQLVSYVGRDAFFEGLRHYLDRHAWANATLGDLLAELQAASGRDLTAWSRVWLEESGVTALAPRIEVDEQGRISRLDVVQDPLGHSLRPHRLAVAGYDPGADGRVEQTFREELDVTGESTPVDAAQGMPRPALVVVNDGDLAYAKVRLDPESLRYVGTSVAQIPDELTRAVVLSSVWDMTRDAQYPASRYVGVALLAAPAEQNISILSLLLAHVDEAVGRFVAGEHWEARQVEVGDRLLFLARSAPLKSDQQKVLVRATARSATSDEQIGSIEDLLSGAETLAGLDLDVDLRWDLLFALVRAGRADREAIDRFESLDPTMTGHQNAAAARAALPTEEAKRAAWDAALHDASLPNDTRWATVRGFWAQSRTAPKLYAPYVDAYFDELEGVWSANTFHTAVELASLLFPTRVAGRLPGVDVAARAQSWLAAHPDASGALRRVVVESQDQARRIVAAQRADAAVH